MTQIKSTQPQVCDLIRSYPGKWVALNVAQDTVLGVANTARAVLTKAQKKGESFPHLVKVPDSSTYVFVY